MKYRFFLLFTLIFLLSGCQSTVSSLIKPNINNSQNGNAGTVTSTQDLIPIADPEVLKKKIIEENEAPVLVVPEAEPEDKIIEVTPDSLIDPTEIAAEMIIPEYLNLPVAFASQAPFANWDALHEEACEEASMIMVQKYFNQESLSPHIMEQAILNLVKWEEGNGYLVDLTARETAEILESYFKLKATVYGEATIDNIKKQLVLGKLVIIPAAGRLLGNPNFSGQGPIYHMLVVRGFDNKTGEFITNDPGTRKGEGYRYKYSVLINAIHDWSHKLSVDGMTDEEIVSTIKAIVIVEK